MKKRMYQTIVIAFAIISIVGARIYFINQSKTGSNYYNALSISDDVNHLHSQEIKTDNAEIGINVTEVETGDFASDRYKLTVTLANRTGSPHGYKLTLNGYSSSLICDTSRTEITYGEHYSSGDRNNARTIYYFEPTQKTDKSRNVGSLSYMLLNNDPTASVGVVEIGIVVYSPHTQQRIESITQQLSLRIGSA